MRKDFYRVQRAWTIAVVLDPNFTNAECRVAICWAQKHLNRHTEDSYVSQKHIAEELGLHPKTAQRSYEKLEEFGYVEKAGY